MTFKSVWMEKVEHWTTERLWRTVKYEQVYLKEYKNVKELRAALAEYFEFYNNERFHM